MDRRAFEKLVAAAIDELPAEIRDKMENVEVIVETWPGAQVLAKAGVRRPSDLLGFYQGVPRTRRTHRYGLVLPDKISIYQGPIELRCRTEDEMRQTVRRVLRHEIAHHFGLSDAHLRRLGAY
ncbi:MAG: metallopeptidase family protein [Anaerolineae bacterium]